MPPLPSTRSTTGATPAIAASPTRPTAAVLPAAMSKLSFDAQVAALGQQLNDLRQRLGLAEQQRDALERELEAMQDYLYDVVWRQGQTDVVRQDVDGTLVLPNSTRFRVAIGSVALTIDGSTVSIDGPATVRVSGGTVQLQAGTIDLTASLVKLSASQVKADGTVQCDTLVANTVVGSSYTPGAGNIW